MRINIKLGAHTHHTYKYVCTCTRTQHLRTALNTITSKHNDINTHEDVRFRAAHDVRLGEPHLVGVVQTAVVHVVVVALGEDVLVAVGSTKRRRTRGGRGKKGYDIIYMLGKQHCVSGVY